MPEIGERGVGASTQAHMQQYMSDQAYKAYKACQAHYALEHGDMRAYRDHSAAAGSAVDIYEQYGGK